eukprot:scaffold569_cov408-Prasinococcus_capsulatus_cf.AAC.59
MELLIHECRSMLVSRSGCRSAGRSPLPTSIRMQFQTVRAGQWIVGCITTSTQQEQAIASRGRRGVHSSGWASALGNNELPLVWLAVCVQNPHIIEGVAPIVSSNDDEEASVQQGEHVCIAGTRSFSGYSNSVPDSNLSSQVQYVQIARGKSARPYSALHH